MAYDQSAIPNKGERMHELKVVFALAGWGLALLSPVFFLVGAVLGELGMGLGMAAAAFASAMIAAVAYGVFDMALNMRRMAEKDAPKPVSAPKPKPTSAPATTQRPAPAPQRPAPTNPI